MSEPDIIEKVKIVYKTMSSSFFKPSTTDGIVGKSLLMYCTDETSPKLFHLQLDLWSSSYYLLAEKIKIGKDTPLLTELYIGAPCLVYLDCVKMWCRAEVVDFVPGSDIKVYFVDYGSFVNVGPDQIYDISTQSKPVLEIPKLCFPCVLADVAEDYEWTEEMSEKFFENITYDLFKVRVMEKKDDGTFVVRLYKNLALGIGCYWSGPLLVEYLGIKKNPVWNRDAVFPPGRMSLNTSFSAVVCHVESPDLLYIQPVDQEEKFSSITNSIKPGERLLPLDRCTPGTSCIFFDQNWYRGKVCGVSGENVIVRFVDFGKKITLRPDQVFEVYRQPKEVLRSAGMCLECKLNFVRPLKSGDWGKETKELMEEWFCCTTLEELEKDDYRCDVTVHVYHIDDDKYVVDITKWSLFHQSIAVYLVNHLQARYIRRHPFDPASTESSKIIELNEGSLLDIWEKRAVCPWVDSPDRFSIKLHHWRVHKFEFDSISEGKLLSQPKIGDKYAVKVVDGEEPFRGEIVNIEKDKALIRTLDYGVTIRCPTDQLIELSGPAAKESFATSVLCRLANVLPKRRNIRHKWSNPAVFWFRELVSDSELTVHFLSLSNSVYEVELSTDNCPSVGAEMIKKGLAIGNPHCERG